MLEELLLKWYLHFSLLGLPVYQNKNLVLVSLRLSLFLPYIVSLGFSFCYPNCLDSLCHFCSGGVLFDGIWIFICPFTGSLWCLNTQEVVIVEENTKNVYEIGADGSSGNSYPSILDLQPLCLKSQALKDIKNSKPCYFLIVPIPFTNKYSPKLNHSYNHLIFFPPWKNMFWSHINKKLPDYRIHLNIQKSTCVVT